MPQGSNRKHILKKLSHDLKTLETWQKRVPTNERAGRIARIREQLVKWGGEVGSP